MQPVTADSRRLRLRAGDLVEVRSREEILATLDRDARLDALPFMPEMFQYCGNRYRVFKRADKTCDTIGNTGTRRLRDTVHLDGLRCDGQAHGGCQALCLLFWKEAWLRRPTSPVRAAPAEPASSEQSPPRSATGTPAHGCTEEAVFAATRAPAPAGKAAEERFSCQATELVRATSPLAWWDVRQYARDVLSRNVRFRDLLRGLALGIFNTIQRRRGGTTYPYIRKGPHLKTPSAVLNLRPGELVRVRSLPDIERTLDRRRRNRGLLFDIEEVRYCGKTFRVLARVDRIINDKTGTMLSLHNDCIVLEGPACVGDLSVAPNRLFCPRNIVPFWREIWLERVE
jgi:hypothetical protein